MSAPAVILTAGERSSLRDMATRGHNARVSYEATLCEAHGFTPVQATRLVDVWLHIGAARVDMVVGQLDIRHGAFLDLDMMRRALDQSDTLLAMRATPWRKGRR